MTAKTGARVLVIGLDGATWRLLDDPAIPLPTLRALVAGGVAGRLRSTTPPMTLPAWASVLTGVNPGAHGILDFTRRRPGSYAVEFVNATHRRVPTLHEILSARGRRVASLTVPGTWPPRPIAGVMVSGFDSPVATRAERAHCWPPSLHDTLRRRFGGVHFADLAEGRLDAAWFDHARGTLLREIGRREAVARWLLDQERWDLFMVVFGESDTAAHHFWAHHDPASPRHLPGHADTLAAVYTRLDAAVARLAADAEHVVVVSDHGFGGAGTRVLYLDNWLAQRGWLRFGHTGAAAAGDHLRRLGLRLPVERLVRRLPASLLGAVETRTRTGDLDLAHTAAWSDELSYAPSIHLNVAGRDPLGVVADRGAAITRLRAELLDWRVEGRPAVARVWAREEVLTGPAVEEAPDLFLELAEEDGWSTTLLPSARVPRAVVSRRLSPAEFAGGKGLGTNGTHRPDGVWILHGPRFGRGRTVHGRVEDVAPTVLRALGEAVPVHMEGTTPPGVLHEVTTLAADARPDPWAPPGRRGVDAREARALDRRLAALGYT